MDALSQMLALIPVSGRLDVRCQFGVPWRIEEPVTAYCDIRYHVLLTGAARVEDGLGPAQLLRPGDIVLFPGGAPHTLHDGSGLPPVPATVDTAGHVAVVSSGPDGTGTDLLCGRFRVPAAAQPLLLQHLPARLVVRSAVQDIDGRDGAQVLAAGSRLSRLIGLMREEAHEQGPGSEALLNHLSAALFGLALRLASLTDAPPPGLLALARASPLRPAVEAMLAQPGDDWSLRALAARCNMSRATFIRHFTVACGASPSVFLLGIRMAMACRQLVDTRLSIAAIGEQVGYRSDAAFQRAFKKHLGVTPARWRADARAAQSSAAGG
ncbi:AraC family transcriptional regulator [Stenotrophomonas sp. 24(2023)]|uniref:AraC family transcriptional regulator n=1 Tax=Stenotrophomonas sp. 24(2023) TaxID=3068324 RepID=UPI0027E167CF|nr:AraC family transcriptional regulator [Stenotrophomonas sp. 24(2023)]WMJ68332.1 AraC family transcriptional regulator [Stenotrophomonas sp. 24(2023)]